MATDVDIANLALIQLGQPALASFNDEGQGARLIRAVYEPTVLEVLRSHPWRCCRKRVVLSPDPSETIPFGPFGYAHLLPGDFVGVVKVNNNIDKFERFGRHMLVDDQAPEFTYTARVEEDEFDPGLVSVIAARLAWRLCIPLTDSATQAEQLKKDYSIILQDARFADAVDGAPEDAPLSTWGEARLTGG